MKTRVYKSSSGAEIIVFANQIVRLIPNWSKSRISIPLTRNEAANMMMRARSIGQKITMIER